MSYEVEKFVRVYMRFCDWDTATVISGVDPYKDWSIAQWLEWEDLDLLTLSKMQDQELKD